MNQMNDMNKMSHDLIKSRIREIYIETTLKEGSSLETANDKPAMLQYLFHQIAYRIIQYADLMDQIKSGICFNRPFQVLLEENNAFFRELSPNVYKTSFSNPDYAVKCFGSPIGQLLSYFYALYFDNVEYIYQQKQYRLDTLGNHFIKVYENLKIDSQSYEEIKLMITDIQSQDIYEKKADEVLEKYDHNFRFYTDIIEQSDLTDLRYLLKLGYYITKNDIEYARFFSTYPSERLSQLAKSIVKAYLYGFKRDNKDISGRKTVSIAYRLGQETLVKALIQELHNYGLHPFVYEVSSSQINKQYLYDHRFDDALYLDSTYIAKQLNAYTEIAESYKHVLLDYSGVIYVEYFGEKPFEPESKPGCLKQTSVQARLINSYLNDTREIRNKYILQNQRSFTMVAFPTPDIGEHFEEIFDAVVDINMMDSIRYEIVQQRIVDVLDQADYIWVKGTNGNMTDLKIQMQNISDRAKHTNYFNCVADCNIPLGEIYTTPKLSGTNGLLHCNEVFLEDLQYKDLRLMFKDGNISEFDCSNFISKEENQNYIKENLLYPHDSLPLGEFAIGTNTLAYVTAQKYGITNLLPILIVEKMGPHFAIGDTCYHQVEDLPVFNMLDQKEITARDNERSILRKTSQKDAYTNTHIDITLPYDSIGLIAAVLDTGKQIKVIENGRFVLPGTEMLNEAFK